MSNQNGGHHPIDDERKQYSLQDFIDTAKKELDEYQEQFDASKATTDTHTWDEWMSSFVRYMSW